MKCLILVAAVISCFAATGQSKNVLDGTLALCSKDPLTGWFRDGYCKTNYFDFGTHVVCAKVTDEFLQFSKSRGNDLITKDERYRFPGLKDGDYWCLCAMRWREAYLNGKAPPVNLEATKDKATRFIPLAILKNYDVRKMKTH